MEIKTLRYFLAVAREENMTRASETLHVTQPTLSKQLKALEEELGKKLFTRHAFSIKLTDEGVLLRNRAEDLVSMADKIDREFVSLDGDTEQVAEKLDKGLLDFVVLCEKPDSAKYDSIMFPESDVWGVAMPEDDPLAKKEALRVDDLIGLPLFCSRQSWEKDIPRWAEEKMDQLRLEGSFRLAYNASMFARERLGYLLTFDRLLNTTTGSGLAFRPLAPALTNRLYLVWKRYQTFSPIAERFLRQIRESFEA